MEKAELAARTSEEIAMEENARYELPQDLPSIKGSNTEDAHVPSKEEARRKGYVFDWPHGHKYAELLLPRCYHKELKKQGLSLKDLPVHELDKELEIAERRFTQWNEPPHGDKAGWAEYRRCNVLDAFYEVMQPVGLRACHERRAVCMHDEYRKQKTNCWSNIIYYQSDDTWVFHPDARCTCRCCGKGGCR